MRKVLEHYIPYVEKGKKKYYPVSIEFVFNYVKDEFTRITMLRNKVFEYSSRIQEIKTKIDNKDVSFDEVSPMLDEVEQKSEFILHQQDFFKEQFELINSILKDNGISDTKANEFKFWNTAVDPLDIIDFLTALVTKDNSKTGGTGKK